MRRMMVGLLLGLLLLTACTRGGEQVREISLVARQFAYEPYEVRVNQGERIRFVITSTDVTHGFAIAEYKINQQAVPGQTLVVEFTADKAGTFSMYCSVFCGTGHSEHRGLLIVEGE